MATTSFFSTGNTPSIAPNDFNTLAAGLQAQSEALIQQYTEAQAASQDAAARLAEALTTVGTLEFNIQSYLDAASAAAAAAQASAEAADLAKQAAQASVGDAFGRDYLGVKTENPTLDNEGNSLIVGALYFNSLANELRVYTGTDWQGGVIGASATATVTKYSGTGAAVNFTLPVAPGDKANTQIFISGVYQQKNTYGLSGDVITFSEAPPAGTDNIEILTISTLPLGTTSGATPIETTAATGFTLPTVGRLQTALNGGVVRVEGFVQVSPAKRIIAGTLLATVTADHVPTFNQRGELRVTDGTSWEDVRVEISTSGAITARQSGILTATQCLLSQSWRK